MSYYECENKECTCYGVKDAVTRETFKYVAGEGLVGEHRNCPVCGKPRKYVNPDADIPLSEKNVSIGRYSSASAEQKQEMLKKRSHKHFEKNIKERKDYLMNKAIGEMKSLGKKD